VITALKLWLYRSYNYNHIANCSESPEIKLTQQEWMVTARRHNTDPDLPLEPMVRLSVQKEGAGLGVVWIQY
jgi:hypothetical protein